MKVRVYTPFLPYPVTEAAFHIIYEQLLSFVQLGFETELCLTAESKSNLLAKLSKKDMEPFDEGISIRCLGLDDVRVKTAQEWLRDNEDTLENFLNIESDSNRKLRVIKSFFSKYSSQEEFHYPIKNNKIDLLPGCDLEIFHYSFSYSWISRGKKNSAKRVVILHNLESELINQRVELEKSKVSKFIQKANTKKLKRHEKLIGNFVDELWFFSKKDKETVEKWNLKIPLRLVPPTYRKELRDYRRENFKKAQRLYSEQLIIGMPGGLHYHPNWESAKWIINEVVPILEEKSFKGKVKFVGRSPNSHQLKETKPSPLVEFVGFLPDLDDYWNQLSLLLAPHILGAGIRIKIIESIGAGVPVLLNTKATESLHPSLVESPYLIVKDHPKEWANFIVSQETFKLRKQLLESPPPLGILEDRVFDFLEPKRSSIGEQP